MRSCKWLVEKLESSVEIGSASGPLAIILIPCADFGYYASIYGHGTNQYSFHVSGCGQ